jgi:Ca2+-binding RTX toxin-like protein
LVGLVAALGAFLTLGAGNAFAFSCTTAANVTTLTMANEVVTLAKGNASAITANGVSCGGTTSNVDLINVIGNGTLDALIIDLGGGAFQPGVFVEPAGINEIEFLLGTAATATTRVEALSILGNSAPDTIYVGQGLTYPAIAPEGTSADLPATAFVADLVDGVGTGGGFINLNDDEDADVFAADGVEQPFLIEVHSRGGNDHISGKGQKGTGATDIRGLILDGGDGDDHIQGGDGNDILIGGAGNDTIDGDADSTTNTGQGFCSQFIDFTDGEVAVFSGGDVVSYAGSTGPITLDLDPNEGHPGSATGDGTDVIQNVEGVIGSPANDTLSGDDLDNFIAGNAGDDTIAGDAGEDCLLGNAGNDTFDENEGTSLAQGGTGTTNGEDEIYGGAGLDDTVTYSARTTRVVVYLESFAFGFPGGDIEDGADLDGDGSADDDEDDEIGLDVENAIGGSGNDILVASFINNRADNEFTGNGGNDLMDGGAGNDIFHEGTAINGADDMDGGTGSDTCDYSGRTGSVSVSLDAADNDGEAGEGDNCGGVVNFNPPGSEEGDPVSAQDVENVLGGSGNDVLVGSDDANVLTGNAGNDTISGLGGTDTLSGGDGDDSINGGGGNDAIDGGAGTDSVDYSTATGGVVVNLAAGTSSGDGTDTLTGNENASGSSFQDSIRGDSGNNILNGRGGNDAIQGLDGDDTINGGAGNDEVGGGGGNDNANGGNGSDAIRGGGGDDRLQGGPGRDTLMGGNGDDVLSGGAGADDHRGGPGNDRCIPGSPGLARGDTARGCES